tara:strand:- start:352 stop:564 length:213 start_codon:yes stop_codon:yes gene_type:complete
MKKMNLQEMDDLQAQVIRKALSDNLKSWEELKAIDLEMGALHRRYMDLRARVESSIGVFHRLFDFDEEGR